MTPRSTGGAEVDEIAVEGTQVMQPGQAAGDRGLSQSPVKKPGTPAKEEEAASDAVVASPRGDIFAPASTTEGQNTTQSDMASSFSAVADGSTFSEVVTPIHAKLQQVAVRSTDSEVVTPIHAKLQQVIGMASAAEDTSQQVVVPAGIVRSAPLTPRVTVRAPVMPGATTAQVLNPARFAQPQVHISTKHAPHGPHPATTVTTTTVTPMSTTPFAPGLPTAAAPVLTPMPQQHGQRSMPWNVQRAVAPVPLAGARPMSPRVASL